ncbi:ABC transporter substrate-binding protein [Bifidobacterium aemilianum]|uniref:ABC transporter substrate-binding protein n=2 Tax=Bifidobacterium aemilianum TaxID=2493120 RepID=A0A366KAB8_9BIFI|nr:ABC transporter substrate-binding protein [Bifidobacterium aemilianum]
MEKLKQLGQPGGSACRKGLGEGLRRVAALLLALGLSVGLAACGDPVGQRAGKLKVVSSVNQWSSLARDLGADRVEVTSIVGRVSVDAHDYEPTTQDMAKISQADVLIVNGAGYDSWASKSVDSSKTKLVDLAQVSGIKEGANPHLWFSAHARKQAAQAISKAYESADAAGKETFAQGLKSWQAKEQKLEDRIARTRSRTNALTYAATESVADYLAEDLGMKDLTPRGYRQAAANESEPTPNDIKDFQGLVGQGKVAVLVVNTQETNSMTEQIIVSAKVGQVPQVDLSEQMPVGYQDLLAWIGDLQEDFAKALK